MKQSAVEKQNIPRIQLNCYGLLDQRLVFREVGPEEHGGIKPTGIGFQLVRPWNDTQATIGLILLPQCQPNAHQVFIIKGPVATILVPQGRTAETRRLSHDAIMVTLGY